MCLPIIVNLKVMFVNQLFEIVSAPFNPWIHIIKSIQMINNTKTVPEINQQSYRSKNDNSSVQIGRSSSSEEKNSRISFQPIFFVFMILATLLLAGQNFFHFILRNETASLIVAAFQTALIVITFIGIICTAKTTSKQAICLTFLIDKLFIAMCGGEGGLLAIQIILNPVMNIKGVISIIFGIISTVGFIGSYRIALAKLRWTSCQVITTKISLILALLMFLTLGVLYIPLDLTDQMHQIVQKIFFLLILGSFGIILEIYGKLCDLDGTNQFNYQYVVDDEDDSDSKQKSGNLSINQQIDETITPYIPTLQTFDRKRGSRKKFKATTINETEQSIQ